MALRFGNILFEPLWRRECIANIQITLAESIGVGTRGDFYSRTGALRDMVQNHALQLLTMVAMEPPSRMVADAIRDEKLKVLRSLKPFSDDSVGRDVVRGQYRAGSVDGKARRRLPRRGQGAGRQHDRDLRRPAHRGAELALGGRAVLPAHRQAPRRARRPDRRQLPAHAAHALSRAATAPNKLVIKLQPEDGLELHLLAAKGAGQAEALTPVSLDLDFDKAFAENRVGAYERLLLDVIAGRLNLFVRSDEQEEAWALGRADPRRLAARRRRRRARTPRARGARRRRARWSPATATPGPKRTSAAARSSAARSGAVGSFCRAGSRRSSIPRSLRGTGSGWRSSRACSSCVALVFGGCRPTAASSLVAHHGLLWRADRCGGACASGDHRRRPGDAAKARRGVGNRRQTRGADRQHSTPARAVARIRRAEDAHGGQPKPARKHFSMIRGFHLADVFTLANAACGVAAMLHGDALARHAATSATCSSPRRSRRRRSRSTSSTAASRAGARPRRRSAASSTRSPTSSRSASRPRRSPSPAACAAAGTRWSWSTSSAAASRAWRATTSPPNRCPRTAARSAYFEGTPIPTSVLLTAVLAWAAWQGRVGAAPAGRRLEPARRRRCTRWCCCSRSRGR